MKKKFRFLLAATAGALGLGFAAPALATYTPSLTVEQSSYRVGGTATVDFFILAPRDDDPTAKMTIFSPSGYSADLSHAPGTKLGKAFALVKALGGVELPLSGDVVVGDPNDASLRAAAQSCTGRAAHQEIWVLDTSLAGQSVRVPAFVDTSGPYTVQQICLLPPQTAPNNAQLIAADYSVQGVFTNAPAAAGYQWAGDFTPYIPGTGTPNPAATIEWRTYVGLPSSLRLKRVKSKPAVVKFTGKLSIQGLNPTPLWDYLYAGLKPAPAPNATRAGTGKRVAKSKLIKANGTFAFTRKKVKKKTFFQARFENIFAQPPCNGPSPSGLPIPCNGTDLAPLTSNQVKVLPPKKRRHR